MAEHKIDRRVKYTKQVLRQSLLELMKKGPVNKITVTDICEMADVNRGTFYAHYKDPYDLLHQLHDELYQTIQLSVKNALRQNSRAFALLEIFRVIAANRDLCKILFSPYGDKEFLRRILHIAHDSSMEQWQTSFQHVPNKELEMVYVYIANGSAGVIEAWIQGGMQESPQQMAGFISRISEHGLGALTVT
jgi:AcrR family transcriptional regulator